MKCRLCIAALVPLALAVSCAPPAPPAPPPVPASAPAPPAPALRSLSYTLRLVPPGATRIEIDLRFRGADDGHTRLVLPSTAWGAEQRLYDGIERIDLAPEDAAGARMSAGPRPEERIIDHAPGAQLHVRYTVRQDWSGDRVRRFRPILDERYFQFFGSGVFVYPALRLSDPFAIDLEWTGLPPGSATGRRCGA
jgi:hypothetical protein